MRNGIGAAMRRPVCFHASRRFRRCVPRRHPRISIPRWPGRFAACRTQAFRRPRIAARRRE
ncbi:hypothetical protein ACU4GD_40900 [Cupriavidus basilensis]